MSAPANATFTGTTRELRRLFLDGLESKGETERNVAAHALGLDRFGEYLNPRTLDAARAADLQGFLSYLTELGVSPSSLRTYRTVVARWLGYLAEQTPPSFDGEGASSGVAAHVDIDAEVDVLSCIDGLESREQDPMGGSDDFAMDLVDAEFEPVGGSAVILTGAASDPPPRQAAPVWEPEPTTPMMRAIAPLDTSGSFTGFGRPNERTPDFEPIAPSRPISEMETSWRDSSIPNAVEAADVAGAAEAADFADAAGAGDFADVADAADFADAADAAEFADVADAADFADVADAADFADAADAADVADAAEEDIGFDASSELPSALDGAGLDFTSHEAEDRDRARLQAPPLPSFAAANESVMPSEGEFQGPTASIPIAGHSLEDTDRSGAGDRTQRKRPGVGGPSSGLDPSHGEWATQPGTGRWGTRHARGSRLDLTLEELLALAVMGELGPTDPVRKPNGEWVAAEELRPLRRALGLDGGPGTQVRMARDERVLGRAAAGAVVAGLGSGLLWWVSTLVVGAELVPLAILGGLLGGLGARMAARRANLKVGLLGAAAAPLSVLVGRYLVFETLSSGVALEGFQEIGGFGSFLGSGMGTTQLVCLGLGGLAGLLMGAVRSR